MSEKESGWLITIYFLSIVMCVQYYTTELSMIQNSSQMEICFKKEGKPKAYCKKNYAISDRVNQSI